MDTPDMPWIGAASTVSLNGNHILPSTEFAYVKNRLQWVKMFIQAIMEIECSQDLILDWNTLISEGYAMQGN